MIENLSNVDWNIEIDTVQDFWNEFECKLINVVDKIVPLTDFNENFINQSGSQLLFKPVTHFKWLNSP